MRKDEIEEQIVRMEQEIRSLKADHRDGVEMILAELRGFQDSILGEKIETVRKQLAEGYERMVIGLVLNNADTSIDKECRNSCSRNKEAECHALFLSRIRSTAALPKPEDNHLSENIDLSDEELRQKIPILTKPPCTHCFETYVKEKERMEATLEGLSSYQTNLRSGNNRMFITDLPDEAVMAAIIEPLSHKSRFAMLKALSAGSMTFKELSELTDAKGGHLIYHLTKLTDAGLVIKTDAGKRYSITDRGMGVMDFIKGLFEKR